MSQEDSYNSEDSMSSDDEEENFQYSIEATQSFEQALGVSIHF